MNSLLRSLGFLVFLVVSIAVFGTASRPRVAEIVFPVAHAESEYCELTTPGLITWSPDEIECPVCQTKNIFMVVGSYGNYIYQFPSKYQLVFWPVTDSPSWYSCKKCRYTAFMGEFNEVPKDKIADLRNCLKA